LKRDTKFSPGEILTLLELAEASERNRLNGNLQPSYADFVSAPNDYPNSLVSLSNYPYQKPSLDDLSTYYETEGDDGEWMNTWAEPSIKYFPYDIADKNG
jgi:hypothetical protein